MTVNHVLETFDPALVTDGGPEESEVYLTNAESIDRHFAVNTSASALMMRGFLHRHLLRSASWGRIVGLTTSARHAWNISYVAGKNALVSYCL